MPPCCSALGPNEEAAQIAIWMFLSLSFIFKSLLKKKWKNGDVFAETLLGSDWCPVAKNRLHSVWSATKINYPVISLDGKFCWTSALGCSLSGRPAAGGLTSRRLADVTQCGREACFGDEGGDGKCGFREAAQERRSRPIHSPAGGYILCDKWTRVIKMC